jgi:hypothetical protein
MPCEDCGSHSCYSIARWLSDGAMVVLYYCADHAPDDADYFDDSVVK